MANSIPKIIYNAGAGDVTISFEYPPQGLDYEGKQFKFVGKVAEATNGNYQNSDNYVEEGRNLTFKQVKKSILDQVETFMITFAGKTRKTFKYYVDSDEAEFFTVQLSRSQGTFRPKRTGWNSENEFNYEFKLSMRRAI
tara:strand:- start:105 stop:521 length:417 start_codon:yes stop_codon:yes gene_type:complete